MISAVAGHHDGVVREVEWDKVRDWFDPAENGSAPDIAIEDTTLGDWQALITLIRADGWHAEYEIGDERVEVPASAADRAISALLRLSDLTSCAGITAYAGILHARGLSVAKVKRDDLLAGAAPKRNASKG